MIIPASKLELRNVGQLVSIETGTKTTFGQIERFSIDRSTNAVVVLLAGSEFTLSGDSEVNIMRNALTAATVRGNYNTEELLDEVDARLDQADTGNVTHINAVANMGRAVFQNAA